MSIREQALTGGSYLVCREAVGIVIRLTGIVLVTRLIGPGGYGSYAGPLGIVTVASSVALLGIDVYLLRRPKALSSGDLDAAFTALTGLSVVVGSVVLLASFSPARGALPESFHWPLRVLALSIPVNVLWNPARAKLEREFRYRRLAALELTSDASFYVVAVPLAIAGHGVWAPVAGYCTGQASLLVGSCVLAGYLPRWRWDGTLMRDMARYGLSLSASVWIYRARDLVNPLVVGRALGSEAVGYVAMAVRVTDTLGFVRRATWRISLTALGLAQESRDKLRAGVQEGMTLQILALGPCLGAFALGAETIVRLTLGTSWLPIVGLVPFVAFACLVNAVFNLHSSCMYILGRNWIVSKFHLVHVGVLAVAAAALVPGLGVAGYAWAELAAVSAYVVLARDVDRLFTIRYRPALRWLLAFAPLLLGPWLSITVRPLLLVFPATILATADARAQLRSYWAFVRRGAFRRLAGAPA